VVVGVSVLGVVCLECVLVCCTFASFVERVVFVIGNVMWSVNGFPFHVKCGM